MSEIAPAAYRAGSGEPLLLIHGFTGTWRLWEPILAELTAHYDVFAPTLPGHVGGPPRGRARSLIAVAPGFGWAADDPVRRRIARGFRLQQRLGRRVERFIPWAMSRAAMRRRS